MRKINVDTDSRLAMTGAIRTFMQEQPEEFDPRGYLKLARSAMQKVIGGAHDRVRPGRARRATTSRSGSTRWPSATAGEAAAV